MKCCIFILMILLCTTYAFAADELILNGILEADGPRGINPVANTRISIAGGPGDDTKHNGTFSIPLPRNIIQGSEVIINVRKEGWLINHPLDGRQILPVRETQKLIRINVVIVPKGSPKLLSHERIQKYLSVAASENKKKLANESFNREKKTKAQIAVMEAELRMEREITLNDFLNRLCKSTGISKKDVKNHVDTWAREAASSKDLSAQAWSAYWKGNYAKAAVLFSQSGEDDLEEAERLREQQVLKLKEGVDNFEAAGDSFMKQAVFEPTRINDAIKCYSKTLSVIKKNPDIFSRERRAEILVSLGNAQAEAGETVDSEEGNQLLTEAVHSIKSALEVYSRKTMPQDWARAQNELGSALSEQGKRTSDDAGEHLLTEAVRAYRGALEVFTRESMPRNWATVQNNLGNVLAVHGSRTFGDEHEHLLTEAACAYRGALEVFTRESMPKDWAMVQNNLGAILLEHQKKMEKEESKRFLVEAILIFKSVLEVYTRESSPQRWAGTLVNLGSGLASLGSMTDGVEGEQLLAEAIVAYRKALSVFTRTAMTQRWAETQNNLGSVLQMKGIRTRGNECRRLLAEAIRAYRSSLEVRTYTTMPEQHNITYRSLWGAFQQQAYCDDQF